MMNYYYTDSSNKVFGPIPEEQLHELYGKGAVTPITRVVHEGSEDWQEYGTTFQVDDRDAEGSNRKHSVVATAKKNENLLAILWVVGIIVVIAGGGMAYINRVKLMGIWFPSGKNAEHEVNIVPGVKAWIKDKIADPLAELKTFGPKFYGWKVTPLMLGAYHVATVRTHNQSGGWIFSYYLFKVNNGTDDHDINPGEFIGVGDAGQYVQSLLNNYGGGNFEKESQIVLDFVKQSGLGYTEFSGLIKFSRFSP